MWRTSIVSPRFGSSITTGRLTTAPGPRIATCGLLMIGVSKSAPTLPRLVIVKGLRGSSSGPLGDLSDLLGQPGDRQVPGVLDHRSQEPLLGVHRERDVLAVEVGDLAGL